MIFNDLIKLTLDWYGGIVKQVFINYQVKYMSLGLLQLTVFIYIEICFA